MGGMIMNKDTLKYKLKKQRLAQKAIDNENKGWFYNTPTPIFIPKKQFKK